MAQQKLQVYTKENQFVDTVWFGKLKNKLEYVMVDFSANRTELKFQYEFSKIEAMHKIGKAVDEVATKVEVLDPLLHEVGKLIGVSVRDVKYALKFARTYPKIDDHPGGKLATWNKIKEVYLTESSKQDPEECKHPPGHTHIVQYTVCEDCGDRRKVEEIIEEQE